MMDNEGMTIRQIAEICGVDERTAQRWAVKAADKMPSVADKMSSAGHGKAAKFTLEETLAIIRAGGRHTLADLLAENARDQSSSGLAAAVRELVPAITAAVTTAIAPFMLRAPSGPGPIRQGELALPTASPAGEYYTIKAYASLRGLRVNKNTAVTLGREASRLSRERNIEIRRVSDEEWGQINSYHVSILQEVFTL